ncbi:MAG: SNF2-related protein [Actinomycetota bacterium]|nr:SNF2-related protein [Actinomycetota bacterium]
MDTLLASQLEVNFDATFLWARVKGVRSFEGVSKGKEPPGFIGELREYQREGLGWMEFLRDFGFGGCLADDMGLGKTVQILAMLEARRSLRRPRKAKEKIPPSLIVVPKSLVFNWLQEAERFTPDLHELNHTGARVAPDQPERLVELTVTS